MSHPEDRIVLAELEKFYEECQMSLADIPQRLRDIHDLSDHHRNSVLASKLCGCFCCLNTFPPQSITEWIRREETAMCPLCGIDAVLADKDVNITPELLKEMQEAWFSECHDVKADRRILEATQGLDEQHGSDCREDCGGCTCPEGNHDPGLVCEHCSNLSTDVARARHAED